MSDTPSNTAPSGAILFPVKEYLSMKSRVAFAVSVAFATCVLFCPKPSLARTASKTPEFNSNVSAAVAQREAAKMVPAQAILSQEIDAKKIKAGQQFQAKLSDAVHLKNGVELPKGTMLVGSISTDKMQADGRSRLSLRFTKADLKNGKVIPIEAAIMGIAPPEYGYAWDGSDSQATPGTWNGKTLQFDEIGAVSGFDLHSSIAARNSGVFVSSKKDNMRLSKQTQLSLAIAARNSSRMSGGV
jgi:hypothetical protein